MMVASLPMKRPRSRTSRTVRSRALSSAAIVLFLAASILPGARAEESSNSTAQIERKTHEISGAVLSPFCPGRSLNDCPSSKASDLKREISTMLQSGKSEEQVYDSLYERFGEHIRAVPKREGFGLLAWTFPIMFSALGAISLIVWLRNRDAPLSGAGATPPKDPMTAQSAGEKAELERLVDEELKRS